MYGSSGFDVSFGNGLGNQLLAFTQAYWIGFELACLPTQLMAPDSMNMASHASPKLRPSPRDHLP